MIFGFEMTNVTPLVQLSSLCVILLMSTIVLYGVFRIKIYAYFHLIPHYSDAASMLALANFLCRVVPMLCYNYLQLLNIGSANGIAMYKVMGIFSLEQLQIFGKIVEIFADFFPMILPVLVTLLALFRFIVSGKRFRHVTCCKLFVGVKHFMFDEPDDEHEVAERNLQRGKSILEKEREKKRQLFAATSVRSVDESLESSTSTLLFTKAKEQKSTVSWNENEDL